jgi:hypothetical protein
MGETIPHGWDRNKEDTAQLLPTDRADNGLGARSNRRLPPLSQPRSGYRVSTEAFEASASVSLLGSSHPRIEGEKTTRRFPGRIPASATRYRNSLRVA